MRQCVYKTKLAILYAEEVSVGYSVASRAECAERYSRTDHLVHNEATVGNIHTGRDTDIAAILGPRWPGACVHAAFRTVARVTPRHQFQLLFEECVEVGSGSGDQCGARIALFGGNRVPLFC